MAGGENVITAQIREILRIMRVPHFKHFGGPLSPKGVPDIIGCLPPSGTMLLIEVKTPTGKVSPEQEEFLARYKAGGAVVMIARDPRDVLTVLRAYGFEPAKRLGFS